MYTVYKEEIIKIGICNAEHLHTYISELAATVEHIPVTILNNNYYNVEDRDRYITQLMPCIPVLWQSQACLSSAGIPAIVYLPPAPSGVSPLYRKLVCSSWPSGGRCSTAPDRGSLGESR